jgi:hypothetical protein
MGPIGCLWPTVAKVNLGHRTFKRSPGVGTHAALRRGNQGEELNIGSFEFCHSPQKEEQFVRFRQPLALEGTRQHTGEKPALLFAR